MGTPGTSCGTPQASFPTPQSENEFDGGDSNSGPRPHTTRGQRWIFSSMPHLPKGQPREVTATHTSRSLSSQFRVAPSPSPPPPHRFWLCWGRPFSALLLWGALRHGLTQERPLRQAGRKASPDGEQGVWGGETGMLSRAGARAPSSPRSRGAALRPSHGQVNVVTSVGANGGPGGHLPMISPPPKPVP